MFEAYLREQRKDPEYLKAEEELRPYLDLADDVLALRIERGWSQSELARRAKTGQPNISRIEDGLANPTIKFLQKLARAFGVKLEVRLRKPSALIARSDEIRGRTFSSAPGAPIDSPGDGHPVVIPATDPSGRNCFQLTLNRTDESKTFVAEGMST
jgi:transcriptional regulator with XRE-family HTH domain